MMNFKWFDADDAARIGVELADKFAPKRPTGSATRGKQSALSNSDDTLQEIFLRVDTEVRALRLNFYKKARFANSFKWRLLENGVQQALADEVTQQLVLRLSDNQLSAAPAQPDSKRDQLQSHDAQQLLALGSKASAAGQWTEAIGFFSDLLRLNPRHAAALNNIGAAYFQLGQYNEAESCFRQAVKMKPDFADAQANLGNTLLLKGDYADAEGFLRYALKLNPRLLQARINLGTALAFMNRMAEANSYFGKALKQEPRNPDALFGKAFVAMTEGRFDEAEALLSGALQSRPNMPRALASLAGMRKMTSADEAWLKRAEELASSGLAPADEAELRFAIGKYYDDVENFKRAFENYKRANALLKSMAEPYDRAGHKRFVDTMISAYTPTAVSRGESGASTSAKAVFVVGMPRSGTSLVEQIISSHPSARGAGELQFWSKATHEHEGAIRAGSLRDSTRSKLADAYLRVLEAKGDNAIRVVDKAPVNSDFLGLIHSVFPNARFIYMQRNPIDICVSCYFQKFGLSMNYTMDLSDLADYYREHSRLMAHWRDVLPPGTLLEVPYEQLVVDQEGWTRKILDFLGLEWNERALDFQNTKRHVVTASYWQVRQRIYKYSVDRWRHYEKHIGPLLPLQELAR